MLPVKVVMADDEPGVMLLLCSILSKLERALVIGAADNAKDAIALVREHNPDLAFLDIELPDIKGIELKMISDPEYRRKEGIKLVVESTAIKVHPDQEDIKSLIQKTNPSAVMLFHAKTEDCRGLSAWIENRNIRLVCAVSQPLSF